MYHKGEGDVAVRVKLQWGAAFAANGLIYANDLAEAAASALDLLPGILP